jgi:ABC-type oligopeptide transport system ATPase subunit
MNLAMKKNSIEKIIIKIIYIWMFTTSILRVGKKKQFFAENIHILSNTWNLLFKVPKPKDPNQVFASALEKHNYINLVFETNANNS